MTQGTLSFPLPAGSAVIRGPAPPQSGRSPPLPDPHSHQGREARGAQANRHWRRGWRRPSARPAPSTRPPGPAAAPAVRGTWESSRASRANTRAARLTFAGHMGHYARRYNPGDRVGSRRCLWRVKAPWPGGRSAAGQREFVAGRDAQLSPGLTLLAGSVGSTRASRINPGCSVGDQSAPLQS